MALDTITGLKAKVYTITPPASYATGGFAVTADTDFSWIMAVEPEIVTRGSLPACDFEIDLNVTTAGAESMGNGVIKVVTKKYDKATITGATGLPGGTATQAAKFATGTTTGSDHTHSMDHDHPATTSGAATNSGGAVVSGAGGNMTTHTHSVNLANFTGSTSSTTHTHNRSFEYEHDHSYTETTTDVAATELTAATNISDASLKVTVYGFGKE